MLRATRKSLFVRKTFNLSPPKVDMSFNLHTTAGVSYKGKPKPTAFYPCPSRVEACCAVTNSVKAALHAVTPSVSDWTASLVSMGRLVMH